MSDAVARESPTARCGGRNVACAVCPPLASPQACAAQAHGPLQ